MANLIRMIGAKKTLVVGRSGTVSRLPLSVSDKTAFLNPHGHSEHHSEGPTGDAFYASDLQRARQIDVQRLIVAPAHGSSGSAGMWSMKSSSR